MKTARITTTPAAVSQPPLPDLPQEIVIDILTRLPVKTLIRFRCVSKSWLSLISNPQFIRTHLTKSSASGSSEHDYTHYRLILSSIRPHFDLRSCSLSSVLNSQPENAVELDYPLKNPNRSVWILGSCNGLVCIAVEEDSVILWNPSTRKWKRLPDSGMEMQFGSLTVYGFGFDECSDDYKVVGIFCVVGNGDSYESEVRVYSLRTDSWRRIGGFPYGTPLDDTGKFANGSLHWAVSGDVVSWAIVSLDLARETYGEIPQPSYNIDAYGYTLGILGGCVSVLSNFQGTRADLWVMKEYGVRSSWVKLSTIPYLLDQGIYWYSFPLWISSSGEILMELEKGLVLYNPNDGTFKYPKIRNLQRILEAAAYVESLVPPNFDNPLQGEQWY